MFTVYCVADALWKTVMSMDGMLANFLAQLSRLLCAVQPMHDKKQPFTETELSPIFSWNLSSSLGTVRPFCYEKMRSAWTELSPFFSETTFGLPSRLHPTRRSRDVLLWVLIQKVSFWPNFEVILGSKTVLWTHSRLLGPIWRPGGPQGQNSTIFVTPCFGTFFGQVFVLGWKYVENPSQILVFVPSVIFERFLIDFEFTFGGQKWSQV